MTNEIGTVNLSVQGYNLIKAENYKLNMLLDSILNEAMISSDHEHLVFNSARIENALQFVCPERYKKRLSTLKTQNTRYGTYEAKEDNT